MDDEARESIEREVAGEILENKHLQDAIVALAVRTLVQAGIRCDGCARWDGETPYSVMPGWGTCEASMDEPEHTRAAAMSYHGDAWLGTAPDHFCRMFERRPA